MSSLPTLSANASAEERDSFVSKLLAEADLLLKENPDNRCCKYLIPFLNSDEGKKLTSEGE